MSQTDFHDPVLLTGVGRQGQVGEVVARAFAERGATVLLVDRTAEQARDRAASLTSTGLRASSFGCDLADPSAVASLAERIRREHGDRLSAVVHAAGGFALSGSLPESDLDVWQRMLTINLTTAYLVTRAFLPFLRSGKGAAVYFASEAALPGAKIGAIGAYAVAKSGVATLMRSVAQSESQNGVRANAIAPSSIRTAANLESMGKEVRYVEREEVASAVVYLCSAASSAVNGQLIALS